MSWIVEKYNPAWVSFKHDQIMSKRLVPGHYIWALLAPVIAGAILANTVTSGWWALAIIAPWIVALVGGFVIVCCDIEFDVKQLRLFNRGRVPFRCYSRMDIKNPGPETKVKMAEYFDHIRSGSGRSEEVEYYIYELDNSEKRKFQALADIARRNNSATDIIDKSIINRIDIESEELRKIDGFSTRS